MILIFGGTTEGRMAVEVTDEGEGGYFYSTFSDLQRVDCARGIHISGSMDETEMEAFCRENSIRLIVDAAHPFAEKLHLTVDTVSRRLGLPVVRFERRYPTDIPSDAVWCEDYDDAVAKLTANNIGRLLSLTGVQTIPRLKDFWQSHETFFRILDRQESFSKAGMAGFPRSHLLLYDETPVSDLISKVEAEAVLTKESGISGGFGEKIMAAKDAGIKIFIVRRPKLPDHFITVDGRHGMRREIERIIPEYYPLHTGFTTGSCATAAAKAALSSLLTGETIREVVFRIPEGETMRMAIESVWISENSAVASVIKDAGDDPDVTDGSRISVKVAFSGQPGIHFYGGEGIGTVTMPGLGLAVGEPAINPVPRKNIEDELRTLYSGGLDVRISLENGGELAEKTFNPRVGVIDGVSIIGTTGIIRPFSHEAFLDCIRREVDVALAMDCGRIVVNSGGKSERFMKREFPDLPAHAFIHYGNAVGDMMRIGEEMRVRSITIGIMLGKAVKLAEGNMDTHSHKITVNREFLKALAVKSGCSKDSLTVIDSFNLARELPSLLSEKDAALFFPALLRECHIHCHALYHGVLDAYLIADDGTVLSRLHD